MNFGPHSVSCRCAGCPKSSAGNNDTRARSWTCAIQIVCRCPMVWKADTISISYLTRFHRQRAGYMSCHSLQYLILRSVRSEEHTSELQSLMRISYAVSCLTKKHDYALTDISL